MTIDKQVVPAWCQASGFPDFEIWGCRGTRGFKRDEIIAAAWPGCDVEHENSGLVAFGYLWRRFGPPSWGSDDRKELCSYVIRTPDSAVFLELGVKAMPLSFSVGFLADSSTETTRFADDGDETMARIRTAVIAAMREMLRPVYVRDVPINIFGRVTDEYASDWEPAERSKYAGLGVPIEAMDALLASDT